jgi:hypothetical protein
MTREEWLQAVARGLAPLFRALGKKLPPYRVSIGFPSSGKRGRRLAECHAAVASKDRRHEIFIRPDQDESWHVAALLAHELVHCAVGLEEGHGPAFREVALGIGLLGPMRHTQPGPAFMKAIVPLLKKLGPIPHAELRWTGRRRLSDAPPKQTTRLVKAECSVCGYTVRLARSWADIAPPICPLDSQPMEVQQ